MFTSTEKLGQTGSLPGFPKDRIEEIRADFLEAPRFSSFQGVATRPEGYSKKMQ